MPAINVSRTDTFEVQRQKINELGDNLFQIYQGGSDLSTGVLRIGDGTVGDPSLGFISDTTLGFYKSGQSTLGVAASGKKIFDYKPTEAVTYQDFIVRKNSLTTTGIQLVNGGSGYDEGTYLLVGVIGGTGQFSEATVQVVGYSGSVTQPGENYTEGSYSSPLLGGNGTGATLSFTVPGITGEITDGGSGYRQGVYLNQPFSNGSGSGGIATISVAGSVSLGINITNAGSGLADGEFPGVPVLNDASQTFVVTTVANPGTPPPDNVFQIDGVTQDTLTIYEGNTYYFDVSSATNDGHPLAFNGPGGTSLNSDHFIITKYGNDGASNSIVELVVRRGAASAGSTSLEYVCENHDGMGGAINVSNTGAQVNSGDEGSGGTADITVAGGIITVFNFVGTNALNYRPNDSLTIHGGSLSFAANTVGVFEISSETVDGSVTSVLPTSSGASYDNGDVLGWNSAASTPGSGFEFTLNEDPGSIGSPEFSVYGIGYSAGNVLNLPGQQTASATISFVDESWEISVPTLASLTIASGFLVSGNNIAAGTTLDSFDTDTNQISLSPEPTVTGNPTLTFTPPWGSNTGSDEFEYTINQAGVVNSIVITEGGVGYSIGDTISISPGDLSSPITKVVTAGPVQELTFSPALNAGSLAVDDVVKVRDGVIEGGTPTGTTTSSSGEFTVNQSSTTGSGTGASFLVTRGDGGEIGALGEIISVDIVDGGFGHVVDDVITINGGNVGGSTPADNITFLVESSSLSTLATVRSVPASGSIGSILIDGLGFVAADILVENGTSSPTFTVASATTATSRFFIDGVLHPDLTLYSGDTYQFDYTSDTVITDGTIFKLSEVPDGEYYTVQNLTTTLTLGATQAVFSSVTGLVVGMSAAVTFGDGAVPTDTTISSIDGTTITFSLPASTSGSATFTFRGTEYTEGVSVAANILTITINDSTPDLYIYSSSVADAGGIDGQEGLLTTDNSNPKAFGSGVSANITNVESTDVIVFDVGEGKIGSTTLDVTDTATINIGSFTTSLATPEAAVTALTSSSITATTDLSVTAVNTNFTSNVNVGSLLSLNKDTGKVETSGEVKTLGKINSNDLLFIENAEISTAPGTALILKPGSTSDVTEIDSVTALKIPAGLESDKPSTSYDGYIRFNTTTNQYEGYSATNGSWSSLGGVRDLDGNTTILAEESVGANDNTLWFINDNINTVKFTPEYQEFVNVKKIRSINTSAPTFTNWVANGSLVTDEYVKYSNNIYLVVSGGQAATSGNEPTDTSGNNFANGSATLKYFTSAVSFITYEEVSEVRIDPAGFTDLVVNNELRFSNNNISSTLNDIFITPSTGKKVKIDIPTSLVLPVGDNNSKGSPERGSIRYNTDDTQFEGYNGAQWGGLGGVKDIDQDTEIKAESSPGADEDILFFKNGGNNTLRITSTAMEFDSMDTISSVSSTLNIEASEVTFNSLALTIDTDTVDTCFVLSSKEKLDIGLSSGLNTDHLIRFNNTGETIYNLGFGTGNPDNIVMLNSDLTNINYKNVRISTTKLELEKGLSNTGNASIYNKNVEASAKVIVTANNLTTGDKEITEYLVIDDGTDIFFTDTNNVKTGQELISSLFDIDGSQNVRISLTLGADLSAGDNIEVTVVNTITKR